jgi:hypothetical protein
MHAPRDADDDLSRYQGAPPPRAPRAPPPNGFFPGLSKVDFAWDPTVLAYRRAWRRVRRRYIPTMAHELFAPAIPESPRSGGTRGLKPDPAPTTLVPDWVPFDMGRHMA